MRALRASVRLPRRRSCATEDCDLNLRVFVYGTLLPGERNHHYLADSERVGPASSAASFELYDLGTYPALVAGGAGRVLGAVYRVSRARLDWLDRLEECPELYRRVEVELVEGPPAHAYVLPRARLPREARAISDGDWCAWRRGRGLDLRLPTWGDLAQRWSWRPIPGCPGRSVLQGGDATLAPADLLGPEALVRRFEVSAARDPVWVSLLPDGGVISYERPDASFVHTLNTPTGLARKLAQLGIGV